jgi:hypothetical protein
VTQQFSLRLTHGLRLASVAACLWGGWWSWKLARADFLFREDTADAVRAAIRLVPDQPQYYMRLAQLDGGRAPEYLETALALNRYNAQASIELALQREADGDYASAEKLLLDAFAVDRTFISRWTLANFYFRRDDMPAFWKWARRAAEMPANDIGALFQLCWRAAPDPELIANRVLTDQPDTIRQYLAFLLNHGDVRAAATVASHLLQHGQPDEDRPLLLGTINRAIDQGDTAPAISLWRALADRRWVVADQTLPNNSVFAREPVPVAFDWRLPSYEGLHSWPGPSGLEVELTGREPENCVVAEQTVPVSVGRYELKYSYRTRDIAPDTGLRWQVQDSLSGAVLAASPDLSHETLKTDSVTFVAGRNQPLVRLRLAYARALGTPRISGMLVVVSTALQPHGPQ